MAKLVSPDAAQAYSFTQAPAIPRDRIGALESMWERYGREVAPVFKSHARHPVDVTGRTPHLSSVADYLAGVAAPCTAFVVGSETVGGAGVLSIDTPFAFHLIDRMFGGDGETAAVQESDDAPEPRPLTSLERRAMQRLVEQVLRTLDGVIAQHAPLTLSLGEFCPRPSELPVGAPEDSVLVAELELQDGEMKGLLTVCLTLDLAAPVLQPPEGAGRRAGELPSEHESRRHVEAGLRHVRVDLMAVLPSVRLSARALGALSVGQVIHTRQHVDMPIELLVNGRRRCLGTLGEIRKHAGLQITDIIPASKSDAGARALRGRIV